MTPLDQIVLLAAATAAAVGLAVPGGRDRPVHPVGGGGQPAGPAAPRTRERPVPDGGSRGRRWSSSAVGRRGQAAIGPVRVDLVVGAAVVLLFVVALGPVLTAAAVGAIAVALVVRRHRAAARDRDRVREALPELADLFVVAASAGHPVRTCVELVAARAPPTSSVALRIAVARLRRGATLDEALLGIGRTLGPDAAPLVEALRDGAREGSPITERLRTVAATARDARRREAEARARRVPVRMIFPLVCCTLPAVGLLAVVPLLVASLSSLTP